MSQQFCHKIDTRPARVGRCRPGPDRVAQHATAASGDTGTSTPRDYETARTAPTPDLIDFDELCLVLDLKRTAARDRTYDPDFPDVFELSPGCYRWDRAEVNAWLHGRRKRLVRRARAAKVASSAAALAAEIAVLPEPVAVAKRSAA